MTEISARVPSIIIKRQNTNPPRRPSGHVAKVNFWNLLGSDAKTCREFRQLDAAGQIFITFIRELAGQNKAIDAHRRHGVRGAFYVAERRPLQTPITASSRLGWHIYERNKSLTIGARGGGAVKGGNNAVRWVASQVREIMSRRQNVVMKKNRFKYRLR